MVTECNEGTDRDKNNKYTKHKLQITLFIIINSLQPYVFPFLFFIHYFFLFLCSAFFIVFNFFSFSFSRPYYTCTLVADSFYKL